ncbi:unnamed protein product [Rhizophagus irregularis]|nr:unnamed protein product [Rhizophagus irregularis]
MVRLSAYLTWEKKGTFGALDLEFGNVLSAYSILEETEWFKNTGIGYGSCNESVPISKPGSDRSECYLRSGTH